MPKNLTLTRIGNPVLRSPAERLGVEQISSNAIQALIADMRYTLANQESGVALAATQVGKSIALSIIGIKPTPNRPKLVPFETVIINPEIVETHGKPEPMWEACVSCGSGDDLLFAQVPRYQKVRLRWLDETGNQREEILDGFVAHVVQHETDHLNGIMFVDKVEDPLSFMMADEYRKRVAAKSTKNDN
jgi:peptide deformylase